MIPARGGRVIGSIWLLFTKKKRGTYEESFIEKEL